MTPEREEAIRENEKHGVYDGCGVKSLLIEIDLLRAENAALREAAEPFISGASPPPGILPRGGDRWICVFVHPHELDALKAALGGSA